MALLAYRMSLLNLVGAVCNGSASNTCQFQHAGQGGVVCGGIAIDDYIPLPPPEQPDTILCFKFAPGERTYTCDLEPVYILSARSFMGSNVYRVNRFGRIIDLFEYELCNYSEVIDAIYKTATSSKQRLEVQPIDPPLASGQLCKPVDTEADKQKQIIKWLQTADQELQSLLGMTVDVSPETGKFIKEIVGSDREAFLKSVRENADDQLQRLAASVLEPDLDQGRSTREVPVENREAFLKAVRKNADDQLQRLRNTEIEPVLATGKLVKKQSAAASTVLAIQQQADQAIQNLTAVIIEADPAMGKTTEDVFVGVDEQTPIAAIQEKAQNELDKLRALREEIMA